MTVRGGEEVDLKVRVDPMCADDNGNPSGLAAIAASISLVAADGTRRVYPTDRSWGWRDGREALTPAPLWPRLGDVAGAPHKAA